MSEFEARVDEDGTYFWSDPETGQELYGSEDELDAWSAQNGYEDVEPPLPQVGEPVYDESKPDMWWSDDKHERAAQRQEHMYNLLNRGRENG